MINFVNNIKNLTIIIVKGLFGSSYPKTAGNTDLFPFILIQCIIKNSVEMETNEIWKAVKDYEGLYEVSNYGRVKRINSVLKHNLFPNKTRIWKGHILKLKTDKLGYKRVTLSKNGKVITKLVHRLVGTAFLENDINRNEINHKNGLPWDNYFGNIEWCTRSENLRHSFRILGRIHPQLGKFYEESDKAIKVIQLTLDNKFIKEWECIKSAEAEMNISKGKVSAVCKGYRKTTGGYKWKYKTKYNETENS